MARLYDFVAGTKIRSAQVDAELDQFVVGHNDHDTKIDALQTGAGIQDGGVASAKLATSAVTNLKIAPLAVTNDKIANGTLTADKFVANALTNDTQNGLRISAIEYGNAIQAYVIELSRWGIVQGSFGKPPYTTAQWAVAYNNILGFNAALQYARDNSFNRVIVPSGVYSFCYTNLYNQTQYNISNTSIKLFSHQTFDMNGATFEMMYDSQTKNPYDMTTSATAAWKLGGQFIDIKDCYNTHIINGKIIGDIPNRTFYNVVGQPSANYEHSFEFTYGVVIWQGSSFCSIENMDVSMFMGDGFSASNDPTGNNPSLNNGDTLLSPGYIDNTGTTIAKSGAYVSNKYYIIDSSTKEIQMRSGGGYTRISTVKNTWFEFLFFNVSNGLILRQEAIYLQNIRVPFGTSYVRVQFLYETVGLTSINIAYHYSISKPQPHFVTIENCKVHNNHRGGISGGADFTTIRSNKIYHNGMDSGLGVPEFPSSTRYAINFEDSYSNAVKIENNEIFSGFNGLIIASHHVHVKGNIFTDIGGVALSGNANAEIEGNIFYKPSISPLYISTFAEVSNQERNIDFINNKIYGKEIIFATEGKTRINFKDNVLDIDHVSITGNVHVEGNRFKSLTGLNNTTPYDIYLKVTRCVGNTFSDYKYGIYYQLGVFKYDVDSLIKNNVFKSVFFDEFNEVNDVEYQDSILNNCVMLPQVSDVTKDSTITFTRCNVTDTKIELGSRYSGNLINLGIGTTVKYKDSTVTMTEAYTATDMIVSVSDTTIGTSGFNSPYRTYKVLFENSSLISTITSKIIFITRFNFGGGGDLKVKKTVEFKNSYLKVSDATKFKIVQNDSSGCDYNTAIIRETTLDGITFSTPSFGVLKVFPKLWWNGTNWENDSGTVVSGA